MTEGLAYWWDQTSAWDRVQGAQWYPTAHRDAQSLGDEYNVDTNVVCGLLSILSVGVRWAQTVKSVSAVCWAHSEGMRPVVPAYPKQIDKCVRLLDHHRSGGPQSRHPQARYQILAHIGTDRARKTRAFYCCLNRPFISEAVVVDRWMAHAMGDHSSRVSAPLYRRGVEEMTAIARGAKVQPMVVQASIWICIRNAHRGRWRKERT